ncbi:MAG: amidohydrolase family protein [Alphaproteobacteria bacterium]
MPTDVGMLIDHHCHGLVPTELTRKGFEKLISESFVDAPPGTSHFDSPVGLVIRAKCAPVLDLEPFPEPDRYLERRAELGAAEVNRRFVAASGLGALLIDTGFRSDDILSCAGMASATGLECREVVRIEAVAERVGRGGVAAADYGQAFADALAAACADAVGLKSIVSYRGGFAFDPSAPTKARVTKAAGRWLPAMASGKGRMDDQVLLRHGLWVAAELARARRMPIQFHVGYGDRDAKIHLNNPSLMMDFLQHLDDMGVSATLLHCYPYQREAGYLAEVFPNVYFDVGVILNYTGAMSGHVLGEALELAPFTKQLYSSDAFGIAEFYYLGALLFRRALQSHLDRWIADGFASARDAERIVALIARDNARRIYSLT